MPELVSIGKQKHSAWELSLDPVVVKMAKSCCSKYKVDYRSVFFDGICLIVDESECLSFTDKKNFGYKAVLWGMRGKGVHLKGRTQDLDRDMSGDEDGSFSLYNVLPARIPNPERALILKEMAAEYFKLAKDDPALKRLATMICEGLDPITIRKETGWSLIDIMKKHRAIVGEMEISDYFKDVSDAN